MDGSVWFYVCSLVGAFVTALYSFRLVWLVFFGERHTEVTRRPRWRQLVPLYVLAALSIVGGFVWLPTWMGGFNPLQAFLDTALPQVELNESMAHFAESTGAALLTILIVGVGIALAYFIWMPWRQGTRAFRLAGHPPPGHVLARRLGL